ncbi:MAG: hypothetical protein R6X02_22785 [Enhygromyxa sp.]
MITRSLALLLGLLLGSSCGPTLTPILDVQASGEAERPDATAESCANASNFEAVVSNQVVYIVHAIPEQIGTSIGELEVSVATGCGEVTSTHVHDQHGLAVIPVALPEGAECGATITTSIAQATDRCVLTGADESEDGKCSFACSTDSAEETDGDSGSTG